MTASRTRASSATNAGVDSEFDLVESPAGWQLTITLTERLREALAGSGNDDAMRFAVHIAPNLVPGEPFEAQLCIKDPPPAGDH
jgi:hypothetical protein